VRAFALALAFAFVSAFGAADMRRNLFHFRPIAPNSINPEKQISSVTQRGAFLVFRLKKCLQQKSGCGA
jgi:hypothetical protein